jgi:hypothetical protein
MDSLLLIYNSKHSLKLKLLLFNKPDAACNTVTDLVEGEGPRGKRHSRPQAGRSGN